MSVILHVGAALCMLVAGWVGSKIGPRTRVYQVRLIAGAPAEGRAEETSPAAESIKPKAASHSKDEKKDSSLATPPGPKFVVKDKKNVIPDKNTGEAAPLTGHLQDALDKIRSSQPSPGKQGEDGKGVYESTLERLSDLKFNVYYGVLWEAIRQNWVVPAQLPDCADLGTDIGVQIGPDGAVLNQWIERPSKNATFDYAALKAVVKSNPFPAPPRTMSGAPLEIGFRFLCS